MTDLVKWLRGWPAEVEEFGQCADEIERLRKSYENMAENAAVKSIEIKRLDAEIERLRGLLRVWLEFSQRNWLDAQRYRECLIKDTKDALGDDPVRQSNNPPT